MKTLRGHKGNGVVALSIHPSGRMALSLGKDKTLVTWDLMKGRASCVSTAYASTRHPPARFPPRITLPSTLHPPASNPNLNPQPALTARL